MINIKNFDSNLLKWTKIHTKILIFIAFIITKDLDYINIHSVNPLYFIIDKADGYIEVSNGNKYLTLVSTNKNKDILRNYIELQDKIKDLIKTINDKTSDYDKKYMKIKFNSDDNLPSNKILKLYNMIIVVRSVFQEDKKYYQQIF